MMFTYIKDTYTSYAVSFWDNDGHLTGYTKLFPIVVYVNDYHNALQ